MKKWMSSILATTVLAGSLVWPIGIQTAAAAPVLVASDSHSMYDYWGGGGKSAGIGASIPSASKDYTIRLYQNYPPDSGNTLVTFRLRTQKEQKEVVLIDNKQYPRGYNGTTDFEIPESPDGSPFTTYSMSVKTGNTNNPRSYKLDVYYEDVTPPTAPTVSLSKQGWSADPVQVTIGGSTDDSGIASYVYQIDNGPVQTYAGPFAAPEGQHMITALAYDNSGLDSMWSTPIMSQYAPNSPSTPVIQGLPSGWTNKDVPFTITPGQDNVAGVASTQYQMSGATVQDWISAASGNISKEGQTVLSARTVNNAGQAAVTTDTVRIDKTKPRGQLKLSTGDYANSVTIIADGTDALSGMESITLPDGKVVQGDHAEYEARENGLYTFMFKDHAGNSVSQSISLGTIDNLAPEILISPSGTDWTDQKVEAAIQYSDKQSGLDMNRLYYRWTKSSELPITWTQAKSANQLTSPPGEGIWYLHAAGYDKAGNRTNVVSKPYHLQSRPETPKLHVVGTATDTMLLTWPLPAGEVETDGLQYTVKNETTGKQWVLNYPENKLEDRSLSDGSNYNYTITASNHIGSSQMSQAVTGVTLPAATVSASVYAVGTDYSQVKVTFDPVKGAESYRITATNLNTKEVDADRTVTGSTYQTISGLKDYVMYDFSFRAVNASGEGAAHHVSFLSLPDQINGFTFAQITADSIELNWNTVTRSVYGDTYYDLERDNQLIFHGAVPHYKDSGLSSGTAHNYSAAAGNATGLGTKAVLDDVWTLPAAPTKVEQIGATQDSFTITNDIPKGTDGFKVRIDGKDAGQVPAKDRHTFTGFHPGTAQKVELIPYNKSGQGRSISLIAVTLPDIPAEGAIKVVQIEENSVTFDVYEVPGASKYKIEIDGKEYEVGPGRTTISDLDAGSKHDYSFSGGNAAGYGEAMKGTILTLPAAPTHYVVKKHSPTTLQLGWDAVKGADYYQVYTADGKLLKEVVQPVFDATNLQPGERAQFKVNAVNRTGAGAASSFTYRTVPGFEDEQQLDWTKLVKVEQVGVDHAQLEWTEVPGADRYQVYDDQDQLMVETPALTTVLNELHSAERYTNYTIVPINGSGPGRALPVPTFVTLPSQQFEVTSDSTRSTVTLYIDHKLSQEIVVIESQGKELYHGKAEGFHQFTQEQLQNDSYYVFQVWTENERGDQSKPQELQVKTLKKKVVEFTNDSINQVIPVQASPDNQPQNESGITADPIEKSNPKKEFIDIDKTFAKASITRLADMGIINGVSDELYAPQAGTTRAEFMAILTRLTLTEEQITAAADQQLSFADIDRSSWYMPELRAAIQHGIAKGYGPDDFKPNQAIDREQAAKMLSGALYSLVPEIDNDFYADANKVSPWARKEVNGLTATDIVEGYPDQTFRPHANLTRAESAAMIDRAMQKNMITTP